MTFSILQLSPGATDLTFQKIAEISSFNSLIITSKFTDVGDIEIQVPATVQNFGWYKKSNYIYNSALKELFRLTKIEYDSSNPYFKITGEPLEYIFKNHMVQNLTLDTLGMGAPESNQLTVAKDSTFLKAIKSIVDCALYYPGDATLLKPGPAFNSLPVQLLQYTDSLGQNITNNGDKDTIGPAQNFDKVTMLSAIQDILAVNKNYGIRIAPNGGVQNDGQFHFDPIVMVVSGVDRTKYSNDLYFELSTNWRNLGSYTRSTADDTYNSYGSEVNFYGNDTKSADGSSTKPVNMIFAPYNTSNVHSQWDIIEGMGSYSPPQQVTEPKDITSMTTADSRKKIKPFSPTKIELTAKYNYNRNYIYGKNYNVGDIIVFKGPFSENSRMRITEHTRNYTSPDEFDEYPTLEEVE